MKLNKFIKSKETPYKLIKVTIISKQVDS